MNISGPAAVAKPEMLFYAPGDLTVTLKQIQGRAGTDCLRFLPSVFHCFHCGFEADFPAP